jgi:hypothetical protein
MDMNSLGGFNSLADNVLDTVSAVSAKHGDGWHHIHGSPVFWNGPDGPHIYVWPEDDQCNAFKFLGNSLDHTPISSNVTDPDNFPGGSDGMPGGILTISANGSTDGILWANHPWSENLNQKIGEGVLRAFDARPMRKHSAGESLFLLQPIWSSRDNFARDDFGNFAKFCPPTVAQGRVYIATMGGFSHHVPFSETAVGGPAMINRNDDDLVLGYSDTHQPSRLNLISSTDGRYWPSSSKVTIPSETTRSPLALAFDESEPPNGRSFIAWTGANHRLNVMSTTDPGLQNWANKHTLNERSNHGPALAMFNGRLFTAWTGTDDHLNVISSSNLGATWQNKRTLPEKSHTEPALTVFNGKLILMWSGTDTGIFSAGHHLNFLESSDGLTWGHKVTIDDRSQYHPAMAVHAGNTLYFCWTGDDKDKTINLLHPKEVTKNAFNANPTDKRVFQHYSANGPCLCEFKGKMFIAWTGRADNELNVGRLSHGAVAVYGLLRAQGSDS